MKNIEKAAQIIKLLVLDVDGVMTDGSIYLDAEQELFKSFNAKDGMGISCAIRCGLQVAIITGRCSPIIRRRARELGIVEVCENVKEKRSALAELLQKYNVKRCCYGHIHGAGCQYAFNGTLSCTDFMLVSADHVKFKPVKLI